MASRIGVIVASATCALFAWLRPERVDPVQPDRDARRWDRADHQPCPLVQGQRSFQQLVRRSLQSLGVATSTVTGAWSFTLPVALTGTQGLRTISTINNYGTIAQYEADTSTRLSRLYADGGVASVASVTPPPAQIAKGKSVTITVMTGLSFLANLVAAAAVVDYIWSATSLAPPPAIGGGTTSARVLN